MMNIEEIARKIENNQISEDEAIALIKAIKQAESEAKSADTPPPLETRFQYDEPYLSDHLVDGERVILGVTHCSLAIDAARQTYPHQMLTGIRKLLFVQPISLSSGETVTIVIQNSEKAGRFYFQNVYTKSSDRRSMESASGEFIFAPQPAPPPPDFQSIRNTPDRTLTLADIYHHRGSEAIVHGPALQTVRHVAVRGTTALAELRLSEAMMAEARHYDFVHPALLDGAVVAGMAALSIHTDTPFIPLLVKEVRLYQPVGSSCTSYSTLVNVNEEIIELDCWLYNEVGQLLLGLTGFMCKRLRSEQDAAVSHTDAVQQSSSASTEANSNNYHHSHDDLTQRIEHYLLDKLRPLIDKPNQAIHKSRNFMDLGVTSTQLITLVRQIEAEVKLELYPTLFFEYQNVTTLSAFMGKQYREAFSRFFELNRPAARPEIQVSAMAPNSFVSATGAGQHPTPRPAGQRIKGRQQATDDIAIIGIAGVFPQSPTIETFWQHLYHKIDLITEIPTDHFDYTPWYDPEYQPDIQPEDKMYCKWGSFIDDVDKFDTTFFNISPREAALMDPQLRYLLQVLYHTAEDAGYGASIRGSRTGMFVGACFHDYAEEMFRQGKKVEAHDGTGNSATMLANRPSFYFDLTGPSLTIDTACSSSLFALHYACQALKYGECKMAFAAGVNLLLSSAHYRYFCSIGALSPTGRCHTFDAQADGYVPGEAITAVLLKPFFQARQDGDHIYGLIKGSAVGHGGYTPSITAPSVDGEVNVILAAWEDAGINPETLGYIEAHGTGTKLGDPIEISALNKAFKHYTLKEGFCGIGSVKAHIGHTEGAAGLAGVIKALLSIRHGIVPAMPKFETLNPYIQLERSPFYINQEPIAWQREGNRPRRAGVSSFGFGGAYAHLVLEEYQEVGIRSQEFGPEAYLIVLSARDEARLKIQAGQIVDFVEGRADMALADMAYTLQVGREAMEERLAVVVTTIDDLAEQLRQFHQGATEKSSIYRGHIETATPEPLIERQPAAPIIDAIIANRDIHKLARLWTSGIDLDWRRLYVNNKPKLISLPTYPFAKERHWLSNHQENGSALSSHPSTLVLHPLVHQNISDLTTQSFRSTFSGDEFFLRDHQIQGEKTLPGVAYLEMVRFAGQLASKQTVVQLRNIIWTRPLQITDKSQIVDIVLYPAQQNIAYQVITPAPSTDSNSILHSQGTIVVGHPDRLLQPERLNIEAIRTRCALVGSGPEFRETLAQAGLMLGQSFWSLTAAGYNNTEAWGKLQLPSPTDSEAAWGLHPSLMDGALHPIVGLMLGRAKEDGLAVPWPFGVQEVNIYAPITHQAYTYVTYSDGSMPGGTVINYDIVITDESGEVCVALRKFSFGATSAASTASVKTEPVKADTQASNTRLLDEKIRTDVQPLIAEILGLEPEKVSPTTNFSKLGFDSITLTGLTNRLNNRYKLALMPTLFFEYNTLQALIAHLVESYSEAMQQHYRMSLTLDSAKPPLIIPQTPPVAPPKRRFRQQSTHFEAKRASTIAIVGMSGRLPGSPDLDHFWANLKVGRDLISEIPPDRWDWRATYGDPHQQANKTRVKWGGFMPNVDKFDAAFFKISPREAILMDPQQRIFLETIWKCIEDAGYRPSALSGTNTGLFVGVSGTDYQDLLNENQIDIEAYTATGISHSVLANRISFLLNLHGPSEPIDTACSSSLVALHRAVEAIQSGSCEMALVGGVNALLTPRLFIAFSQAGMLCEDGRCKTFDRQANGYVRGEGVGAVLLKPLAQAEADGDHIYAVIKGTAVNHGGQANSLTAPNPQAQTELLVRAYQQAQIDPTTVGYIEAHGTGTALGDPIEINGLKQTFEHLYQQWHYESPAEPHCGLGSVKTNIGHLESAAGIAGLLKVLLAIKHQTLPASINFTEQNPYIDLQGSPFYLVTETQPWPVLTNAQGEVIPRRAGVSSFGFGGAYAHVVLEEYQGTDVREPVSEEGPHLIVLSAKNEERLRVYADELLTFLQQALTPKTHDQTVVVTALAQTIRDMVAEILGVDSADIEVEQNFEGYDLDQVQMSRLRVMVEEQYHCELPIALFSGHASVEYVAQHLASLVASGERTKQAAPQPPLSLASIAFTLQTGREAMDSRLALLVSDVEELVERLNRFVQKHTATERVYQGNVKAGNLKLELLVGGETGATFIRTAINNREFDRLAQLWVSGVEIDWHLLYPNCTPPRISLPTYPFAGERYWIPTNGQWAIDSGQSSLGALHPLVHRNTSTLAEQRFSTKFSGTEFFLNDHQIQGRKVLPGAAYLEMARAAGAMAVENETITQIKDVVWTKPIVVKAESRETDLRLHPTENGEIAFTISSNEGVHSQGKLVLGRISPPQPLDISAILIRCQSTVEGEECYRRFKEQGLAYGPTFQGLEQLSFNKQEALAHLRLPSSDAVGAYGLHPSMLDAALQASVGLAINQEVQDRPKLYLPFALQTVTIYETLPEQGYAYVQHSSEVEQKQGVVKYDITLTDEQGEICAILQGFTARAIVEPANEDIFYGVPNWQIEPLADVDDTTNTETTANTLLLIGLERKLVKTITTTFTQAQVIELDATNVTTLIQQGWHCIKTTVDNQPKTPHQILVVAADTVENYRYVPLAGLLKTTRLEHPVIRGKVMTISKRKAKNVIALIRREMRPDSFQNVEIRYQQDQRAVKTLHEVEINDQEKGTYLEPGGAYWITGGMGSLGLLFARHFIDTGENITLILSGRSVLDEAGQQKLTELSRAGTTVIYLPVDVSLKAEVEQAVQTITQQYGPLKGIIHSAGIIRDSFILNKTEVEVEAVLAPKVTGLLNIDETTRTEKLDFMVLFSSIAGVMGNMGQADYAAANAFLDSFAHYRQALVETGQRSGRTLAINWPLWAEGGMRVDDESLILMRRQTGMIPLSTQVGFQAFEMMMAAGQMQQILVATGQVDRIKNWLLTRGQQLPTERQSSSDVQLLADKVQAVLTKAVSMVLKIKVEDLAGDEKLNDYGFDSISLTELANRLNDSYQLELIPTIFFEHNTLTSLSCFLAEHYADSLRPHFQLKSEVKPTLPPITAPPAPLAQARFLSEINQQKTDNRSAQEEPIAIIGMSGQMPGSPDLATFWQQLMDEQDLITETPPERWDWRAYDGGPHTETNKTQVKWGGFIADVDKFDAAFFKISPLEAELMDPQQRLWLQTVWHTIEDAGYAPSQLAGTRTGIFVGVSTNDYQELLRTHMTDTEAHAATGTSHSVLANRISYLLDFHGPSEPIDTACSSALVAIHRAVEALHSGNCELAIAGGVNLLLTPHLHLAFGKAGMLAEDGRCKTFDQQANGYVRSEGVGAIFLKPLAQAEADGDQIYAVIRGTAVNHGGQANSLTAPNPKAQADLLVSAYQQANIDPATVGYIEAHGTGTALGDPIEVNGLKQAFASLYQQWQYATPEHSHCGLGSVKSNIGHLEAAAGIAGVLKVLLALKHQTLPASIHIEEQNPYINLTDSPFYLVTETQAWPAVIDEAGHPFPRRAGVSSFGFGGAYAHVVLEEYQGSGVRGQGSGDGPQMMVLSARDEDRLRAYAQRLLAYLEANPDVSLASLTYTLQVGREAMKARLALVVDDIPSLNTKLTAHLAGEEAIENLYRGQANQGQTKISVFTQDEDLQEAVQKWMIKGKLGKLAELWVSGVEIEWALLYGSEKPRRVSLPTYPFEKKRYWLPETDQQEQRFGSAHKKQRLPEQEITSVTNQLLYLEETWLEQALMAPETNWAEQINRQRGKRLLVLVEDQPDYEAMSGLMKKIEEILPDNDPASLLKCQFVKVYSGRSEAVESELFGLHQTNQDQITQWVRHLKSEGQLPDVIFFLGRHLQDDTPVDNYPVTGDYKDNLRFFFYIVQAFMQDAWDKPIEGYYLFESNEASPRLELEALSGLMRSIVIEAPRHMYKTVRVDPTISAEQKAVVLLREWLLDHRENPGFLPLAMVRYRGVKRYVSSLQELETISSKTAQVFRSGAVYLITGGLGEIGQHLAEYLSKMVQSTLVIFARSRLTEEQHHQIQRIEEHGGQVWYYPVDITDRKALREAMAHVKEKVDQIDGVIHLARAVEDDLIVNKSFDTFARVMGAKVEGTMTIDEVTQNEPLEFFLLFSSMAAYGIKGSADYAYATAFQNAFATWRQSLVRDGRRFGQTRALCWGQWTMDRYSNEERDAQLRQLGFDFLSLETGLAIMTQSLVQDKVVTGAIAVSDKRKMRRFFGVSPKNEVRDNLDTNIDQMLLELNNGTKSKEKILRQLAALDLSLFSDRQIDILHGHFKRSQTIEKAPGQNGAHYTELPGSKALVFTPTDIHATILTILQKTLKLDREAIAPQKTFQDYGLDSVTGIQMSTALEQTLGIEVPPRWLLEYPTPERLADKLQIIREQNGIRSEMGGTP